MQKQSRQCWAQNWTCSFNLFFKINNSFPKHRKSNFFKQNQEQPHFPFYTRILGSAPLSQVRQKKTLRATTAPEPINTTWPHRLAHHRPQKCAITARAAPGTAAPFAVGSDLRCTHEELERVFHHSIIRNETRKNGVYETAQSITDDVHSTQLPEHSGPTTQFCTRKTMHQLHR